MTKKRFKLTDIGFVRSDGKSKETGIVTDEGEFIELKKIVEVMNELYEENQALQQATNERKNQISTKITNGNSWYNYSRSYR